MVAIRKKYIPIPKPNTNPILRQAPKPRKNTQTILHVRWTRIHHSLPTFWSPPHSVANCSGNWEWHTNGKQLKIICNPARNAVVQREKNNTLSVPNGPPWIVGPISVHRKLQMLVVYVPTKGFYIWSMGVWTEQIAKHQEQHLKSSLLSSEQLFPTCLSFKAVNSYFTGGGLQLLS